MDYVEKKCKTLSEAQRQQLAISLDDILFLLPEDVSLVFDRRGMDIYNSVILTLLWVGVCMYACMYSTSQKIVENFWLVLYVWANVRAYLCSSQVEDPVS